MPHQVSTDIPSILYVENDPNDALLLTVAVRQLDCAFELHVVSTIARATEFLLNQGRYSDKRIYGRPATILLDYALTGETALSLLRWIRQTPRFQDLTVIVYSGGETSDKVQLCYDAGASFFVQKVHQFTRLIYFVACLDQCVRSHPLCFQAIGGLPEAIPNPRHGPTPPPQNRQDSEPPAPLR
jgi:CheY-like chemotaxis protein